MGPRDVDSLLVHEPFVRSVARALLRGDARVDDVVQETWVAALKSEPRDRTAMRAWLGGIARNVARTILRRDSTRRRHEAQGPRPPGPPSPERIAAQEEIRRKVLEALLTLDEPYRGAVLLRYYEDLPPREIAKRLDIPVETARTRVKRGLAMLRSRLDREHGGDRKAWAIALAPLAMRRTATVATGASLLASMWDTVYAARAAVAFGALGLVVTLTGFVVWNQRDHTEPQRTRAATRTVPVTGDTDSEGADAKAERGVLLRGRVVGPGLPARVVALTRAPSFYAGWDRTAGVVAGNEPMPRRVAATTSVADGRFELRVPRGSRIALHAVAAGHASYYHTGVDTRADADGLVLHLHPCAAIRGVILDDKDQPLRGATVRALTFSWTWTRSPEAEATTDERGAFTLEGLVTAVQLVVRHPKFSPRAYRDVPVPTSGLRLKMHRGRTVTGNAPPGAHVTVVPSDTTFAPRSGLADADGRFAVDRVGADGPLRFILMVDAGRAGFTVLSEQVWADGIPLDVTMPEARPLRGRVLAGDEPVAGVRLTLHVYTWWSSGIDYGGLKGRREIVSDADGYFEVSGDGIVRVADPRYAIARGAKQKYEGIEFHKGTTELVVPVAAAGVVEGVVDAAGAEVRLGDKKGPIRDWAPGSAFTDADGRFRIEGVAPREEMFVYAFKRGVGHGHARVGKPVKLTLNTIVEGRVTDENGAGLPGVQIEQFNSRWPTVAYTDEQGHYRLEITSTDQAYYYWFGRAGYQSVRGYETNVVLKRAIALTGLVTDDDGPVANVFVRVIAGRQTTGLITYTDETGRFEVEGLRTGRNNLYVWAPGYLSFNRAIELPALEPLKVALDPARAIRGIVRDTDDRPVVGARITAVRERRSMGFAFTDARGAFELRGLRDGLYRLSTYARTAVFDDRFDVAAGTRGLVISAETPASLTGRVTGPVRKGIGVLAFREDRQLKAQRTWTDPNPASTRTDAEGRFTLKRLVGQSFTVWVDHERYTVTPARGVVAGAPVELRLIEGGAITGIVTGAKQGEKVQVRATPVDGRGPTRLGKVDETGRFEIAGLQPGVEYSVQGWDGKQAQVVRATTGATDVAIRLKE